MYSRIPAFQANPPRSFHFRYQNNTDAAITNAIITAETLYRAVLLCLTTTTTALVFQAVKIQWIDLWGVQDPTGSNPQATVKIEWSPSSSGNGLFLSPGTVVSDTTINPFQLAHVRTQPPKQSLASMWLSAQSGSNADLAEITAPPNAVMDIHLLATMNYCEPQILGPAVTSTAGLVILNAVAGFTPVDPFNAD
jgi:hypothetical protein